MKVHLSKQSIQDRSYMNIADLQSFMTMFDDGELDEILVDDFLQEFSFSQVGDVLRAILSKIKITGKVIFYHTDIGSLCYSFNRDEISIDELNKALFGANKLIGCVLCIENIRDLVIQAGFKVKQMSNNEHTWILEAGR